MRVAALFSGGKDSTYALMKARNEHRVECLVTVISDNPFSWMFHRPCIELTELQAEAMGLERMVVRTKGEKEKEVEDLKKALESIDVEGIVAGVVRSVYQKSRLEAICRDLGIELIAPLWGRDGEELIREEVRAMKVMMVSVSTRGLGKEWIGRIIEERNVEELIRLARKFGFDPVLAGGEGETIVLDAPFFKKRIEIEDYEVVWDEKTSSGYMIVKRAGFHE